jgi:hypothetical protein
VFDAVTLIGTRQTTLCLPNRFKRCADGRFLDSMDGNLKAVLMDLPDHFGKILRLWIQIAPAFMQHDFNTAETDLTMLAEEFAFRIQDLRESINSHHYRSVWEQRPVSVQLREALQVIQRIACTRVMKSADALPEEFIADCSHSRLKFL